jgi:pimeloyl-ACP methyl ester carboxylesterase
MGLKVIFIFVSLFISNVVVAQVNCSSLFRESSSRKYSQEIVFEGFKVTQLREKRSMFVKIEKPIGREPIKYIFLLHGLLDSHLGWENLTKEAIDKGYGVVRVDLHGHARTLSNNYKLGKNLLAAEDNYRFNVKDVIQVLKIIKKDHGIEKPDLMGHSYGGGIAIAVAAHPFGKYLIGNNLTAVAPYIYRIDGYYVVSGFPFLKFFKAMLSPTYQAHLESMTSDLYTDKIMTRLYTKHFTHLLDKRVPIFKMANILKLKDSKLRNARLAQRSLIIEQHVDAAIQITKGIRSFDGRDIVEKIRPNLNFNLILAENDKLVPRGLEIEFFNLVEGSRINANLVIIKNSGHMVIEEKSQEVFGIIDQY